MKRIITLFAAILPAAAFAQLSFFPSAFDTLGGANRHVEIGATGMYQAGSNAITNRFLNTVYTGGYIDTTLKADVEDRLLLHNRVGLDAGYGLYARFHGDSSRIAWFAGARERIHADAAFSGDAFRFIMSGNRRFAGKTADLSNFHGRYLHWQELDGGLTLGSRDGGAAMSFGVALLKGQNAAMLDIPRAELFTESTGQYLDLKANFLYRASDTAHTGFSAVNGLGAAFNFVLEAQTSDSAAGFIRSWRFAVLDAGFIRWNDKSAYYHRDTAYHFDGVAVNSLSDLNDSTLDKWSKDSLIGGAQKRSFTTLLPATAVLEGTAKAFGKWQPGFGIRLRMNANCPPEAYLHLAWRPVSKVRVGFEAGYGGYSGFRFGLDAQAGYRGWLVRAGAYNLLAYALPDKTCGQGITAGIAKRF